MKTHVKTYTDYNADDVLKVSRIAITSALRCGEEKYPPEQETGNRVFSPNEKHAEHALKHIENGTTEDLEHALCRIALMLCNLRYDNN